MINLTKSTDLVTAFDMELFHNVHKDVFGMRPHDRTLPRTYAEYYEQLEALRVYDREHQAYIAECVAEQTAQADWDVRMDLSHLDGPDARFDDYDLL